MPERERAATVALDDLAPDPSVWDAPTKLQTERLISHALCCIGDHHERPDGNCSCGYCAWSVDHVLIMTVRQAQEDMERQALRSKRADAKQGEHRG